MVFTLRLRAIGTGLVNYYGANQPEGSIARFVGRKWDESYKDITTTKAGARGVAGGWPILVDGEEIRSTQEQLAEYRRDVLEGALEPMDQETADLLRVPFKAAPVVTKAVKAIAENKADR
jgi:hypothetical protein